MSDRSRSVLRAAIPPARSLVPSVLLGVAAGLSTVALLASSAWLIARAAEQPPVLYLQVAVVGVRAFALGRAVFRYLERLAGHDAAFRQLAEIRAGVFERMLPLAPDGLAASRRGDLLARFVGDVDDLQNVSLRIVQPVASAVVVLVAALAGLAWLAPASALAVGLCLVAGTAIAALAQVVLAARADARLAPLRGELQGAIVEHVQALDVLVAFDAAAAGRERIRRLGARLERATRTRASAVGLAAAAMSAVGGFAAAASLAAAQPLLADGRVDGPTFALLCLVPLAIAEVATAIPVAIGSLRVVRASARRVADAVPEDPPAELPAPPADDRVAAPAPVGTPAIRLRGVRAHWPRPTHHDQAGDVVHGDAAAASGPTAPAALDALDLDLGPGERLLVEGPSGAGKTTLAHVLVRFLEYEGSYRIGGIEARDLDPGAVRRLVGLVEQRPWLFEEDVRQNLLFARDTATDDELLDVLDRVGLRDWVEQRGGLDAPVGERGTLVSGGQAQRLALARAMLADFPVLVLDEPTASVDPQRAETLLRDLLDAAGRDRSVVLISHTGAPAGLVDRRVRLARANQPAA
ncbi:amino acid ABC transporter ATP-binding/permease protein [Agromyces aurantiacus]|uniref:Amino acid ABC transporter ATP-binding/permease protein n=1 Tax=Agromyces aurantiacus TaxID=165814 RepID=A0ABV9RDR1_9MICO|nr:ATP-binding cassette domain-containing protein [Agromyces aurantiacus]MBM7504626.1 ABC-type transport system involved in cytochrome bd biosynthesis fused ATPase/permease subunit [Agromyces aurantiacus]